MGVGHGWLSNVRLSYPEGQGIITMENLRPADLEGGPDLLVSDDGRISHGGCAVHQVSQ